MERSIVNKAGLLASMVISFFLMTATISTKANAAPVNTQSLSGTQLAWWSGYYNGYRGGYYRGWNGYRGGYYNSGYRRCGTKCWINRWGYRNCARRCW